MFLCVTYMSYLHVKPLFDLCIQHILHDKYATNYRHYNLNVIMFFFFLMADVICDMELHCDLSNVLFFCLLHHDLFMLVYCNCAESFVIMQSYSLNVSSCFVDNGHPDVLKDGFLRG